MLHICCGFCHFLSFTEKCSKNGFANSLQFMPLQARRETHLTFAQKVKLYSSLFYLTLLGFALIWYCQYFVK